MVSVGELYQPFGLWTTFLTHHVESFAGQPIGQNSGSSAAIGGPWQTSRSKNIQKQWLFTFTGGLILYIYTKLLISFTVAHLASHHDDLRPPQFSVSNFCMLPCSIQKSYAMVELYASAGTWWPPLPKNQSTPQWQPSCLLLCLSCRGRHTPHWNTQLVLYTKDVNVHCCCFFWKKNGSYIRCFITTKPPKKRPGLSVFVVKRIRKSRQHVNPRTPWWFEQVNRNPLQRIKPWERKKINQINPGFK